MRILTIVGKIKLFENVFEKLFNLSLFIIRKLSKLFIKNNNKKVLVLSFHRLGDTVLTVPVIKYFYEKYKNELIILCFEHSKIIYNYLLPDLEIRIITRKDFCLNRFANFSLRKKVREINPKLLLDITGQPNSISAFIGLPIKTTIGFAKKYFLSAFDKSILQRAAPHLTEKYFEVAKLIDKNASIDLYQKQNVKINKDGKILIHPFAGWQAKEWNIARYIQLAKELNKEAVVQFIFENKLSNNNLISLLKENEIEFLVTKDINQLMNELENGFILISNDSGPIHLAAMIGIPTFSIYGPTNPDYSISFGNHHKYIRKKIHCSPMNSQYCHLLAGIDCPYIECMDKLEATEVFDSVIKFILYLKNNYIKEN